MRKAVGATRWRCISSPIHVRNNKTKEVYDGIQQVLRAALDYIPALLSPPPCSFQRQDYAWGLRRTPSRCSSACPTCRSPAACSGRLRGLPRACLAPSTPCSRC